ncbi:MAG: hypothetical protein HOO96_34085, partial [Polyangiaceae bacterium]|nr:hypothetical protein [Polyangiaceae bacterium]
MRVVLAFAVVLAAKQARAEYEAPPECPSEEEFRRAAGGAADRVDVRIAREEQEYVGRIQPKDAARREIRAGTCGEV